MNAAATTRWQQWTSFGLGLWLAISPWICGYADDQQFATGNAAFMGIALALASHFEASFDPCSAEWLNLAAGLWLVWAPFMFDMGSRVAMANSITVGAFVALLAASALSLDKHIGKLWHRAH